MTKAHQVFHVVARPAGVQSPYAHLVADGNGLPHLPLTEFWHQLHTQFGENTARTYLYALLPYFTYLTTDPWRQRRADQWKGSPDSVRESVRDYLLERLGCKVQRQGTHETVKLTEQSPSTVKVFLAALKSFYTFAKRVGWYPYPHPLLDATALRLAELRRQAERTAGRPPMPQTSGVVDPPKQRRTPENYYRLKWEEWVPQSIDDPLLLKQLQRWARRARLSLRDYLVVTLAAETGARISEILHLTIKDWRARGGRTETSTLNKGSQGRRVKYLVFTPETAKLLSKYINGERRSHDSQHRRLEQLHDTDLLFLSERGGPYTYRAFYDHWQKLCRAGRIKLTIHGLRHWNVTEAIRFIHDTFKDESEIAAAERDLVQYMDWRSPETLQAYNQFYQGRRHVSRVLRPLQQQISGTGKPALRRSTRKKEAIQPQRQQRRAETPPPTIAHLRKKTSGGWGILPLLGKTDHE